MTLDASRGSLPETIRLTVAVGARIKGRDGKVYTVETVTTVPACGFKGPTVAIVGARMGKRSDGSTRRELHNF